MIEFNNIYWNIKFVSSNHPMLVRSDKTVTIGSCDNNTRTIYINQHLQGALLKKVLCHELVHAAIFSYHINLTIDQEELIADFVSTYGEEIIYKVNYLFTQLKERLY